MWLGFLTTLYTVFKASGQSGQLLNGFLCANVELRGKSPLKLRKPCGGQLSVES